MNIKSIIYQFIIKVLKLFWHVKGSRHIKVFGYNYRFFPDTIFPDYRQLRLPSGNYRSRIVRYSDFVQIHSVFKYVCVNLEAKTIIDIGAHHGVYAVTLGKVMKERGGKVIAVEPNPDAYKILKKNVCLNMLEDTVFCEQVAVLDTPGRASIEFDGTQSHVTVKHSRNQVEVKTLEQLLNQYKIKNVNLLIIDVEGAELPVLRGFPWELLKPDKIFCEFHPYAWHDFGYNGDEISQFLKSHQYRCFDMYFHEHKLFEGNQKYIGPTIFIPY